MSKRQPQVITKAEVEYAARRLMFEVGAVSRRVDHGNWYYQKQPTYVTLVFSDGERRVLELEGTRASLMLQLDSMTQGAALLRDSPRMRARRAPASARA